MGSSGVRNFSTTVLRELRVSSGTTDDLKPVYLIVSEQRFMVDEAVERLVKRVSEHADLDFNSETFDAENAEGDAIVIACNTLPFGSEKRLVMVRNIEKASKGVLDALTEYAADPAPTTVLALSGAKLAKNTRLYKAVDALGGVVDRGSPKVAELPGRVQRMFADRGRSVSFQAAELMVTTIGRDLARIAPEVDKVIAYVGERMEISVEDIESVVVQTAPTSIFDFVEALGDRDCRRALALSGSLLDDGESVYALQAMSLRCVRDLMAARSLSDRGSGSAADLARALGRPEWMVRKLVKQVRGFSGDELVAIHRAAVEAEEKMKTSQDSRLAFERWIVRMCGA